MIKVKTIKKKAGDSSDLMDMFNQMTGVKDADPTIIEGKYEGMIESFGKLVGAWEIFEKSDFGVILTKDMPKAMVGISDFVKEGRSFLAEMFIKPDENKMKTEFSGNILDDIYEIGTKYKSSEINDVYSRMKKHNMMNYVIITLRNLKSLLDADLHRTGNLLGALDNPNELSNDFIRKANIDTVILSFSVLDFKFLYTLYDEKIFDKLVLFALRVTYLTCSRIYKLFTSPDIDIAKFVEAFKEKLGEMKKVINGCDGAFKALKGSLKLLETNFSSYYHDFMVTGNPGVIFENFIEDVKNKNKNNFPVLVQFKKLVAYIKDKIPKEMLQNPSVQKLWAMSDKLFTEKK
jgi:hypothetical protein